MADMTLAQFSTSHAAEDGRLARAAQDGDKTAFGALYERYACVIHGLLLSRVPRGDVDDLVQDVFLTAWNRLAGLREPAAFGGWLATIAQPRHRLPSPGADRQWSCRTIWRRTMTHRNGPMP